MADELLSLEESDMHQQTTPASTVEKCSEKFNSTDADIVFRSCDQVLFKVHRKNLETSTHGFPPSGFETMGEIIALPESSSTLELLFQYVYPIPQPDIAASPFEVLANVSEAAEKYQVFPAMYVCKLIMGMQLPKNALPIFAYAGKHGYKDLLVKFAPHLIETPLRDVVRAIPTHLILPWIDYFSAWELELHKARLYPSENIRGQNTTFREKHSFAILRCQAKFDQLKALKDLDAVFGEISPNQKGDELRRFVRDWRADIQSRITKVPPFDAFM